MKKLLLFSLCVILFASNAYSQVGLSAGGHAGIAFLSTPKAVKDFYGFGYGFGGHFDVKFMKNFSSKIGLDYNIYPSDKNKIAEVLANQKGGLASDWKASGANISIFSITASAIGRIPLQAVTPYGFAGVGLHMVSLSDLSADYQGQNQGSGKLMDSQTKFGIHFGAGAEYNLGAISPYVELRWALVFTEGENSSYFPIVVGANFAIN